MMEFRPFSWVVFGVATILVATLPHILIRVQTFYLQDAAPAFVIMIALGTGYVVMSHEQLWNSQKTETTNDASEDSSQG